MAITYTVERSPNSLDVDSEENDVTVTAEYHYDLELDAKGEITGGEWYQNRHPDFIWMPIKKSIAMNREDQLVRTAGDAVKVAPLASAQSVPLKYVLDYLKN